MKRLIGTFVLFALLILTVVALNNVDTPGSSAAGRKGDIQSHATN
ncbi:MAG TPA: hypothetical protein VF733_05645 [Candidatus Saccharimonadales bacterium]